MIFEKVKKIKVSILEAIGFDDPEKVKVSWWIKKGDVLETHRRFFDLNIITKD